MPATISVTGATGFVGRHLIRKLAERGDLTVRALVHDAAEATLPRSGRLHWIRGDLADEAIVTELLEPGCDLVNLAYPASWTHDQHLASAAVLARRSAGAGVRHVLHCSTAVVAGKTAERRVTESTVPQPATPYEVTKLAIEEVWLGQCRDRLKLAILRPTAVYGPDGRNLITLAQALASGSRLTNYLRSSLFQRRRMNLVHVMNVVAAIEHLLDNPAPQSGETYLVSDDEDPANNFRDVEQILMQAWGIPDYPVRPLPLPKFFLSTLLRLMGRSNDDPDRIYDSSKLERAGLRVKPCSLERGLREFASWYVSARREFA